MNTATFNIMHAVEIKNTERTARDIERLKNNGYLNQYINGGEKRPVEFDISKYTPTQLRGFAKAYKNVTYNNIILTVDHIRCTKDMFYAYYIDSYDSVIYGISVDKSKLIIKYVYRYIESNLPISTDAENKSEYTPEQLYQLYRKGVYLLYYGDHLKLLEFEDDVIQFLAFSNFENKIYRVTVDNDRKIDKILYRTVLNTYEICASVFEPNKSNFTPEELLNFAGYNENQLTYAGNILVTDRLNTTLSVYTGHYFDEADTAIYCVTVDSDKNIKRFLHKRIIKTVEIDGDIEEDASGNKKERDDKVNEYTIKGIIDRSDYHIKNINDVYIEYPGTIDKDGKYDGKHFDLWVTVTAREDHECIVHFPENTVFARDWKFGIIGEGKESDTGNYIDEKRTREISIKDGVVVSFPHNEEWMDF